MAATTERVHFRLLVMSNCCGTALCWINPRFPTFCPECGTRCYPEVRSCVTLEDQNATLRVVGIDKR